MRFSVTSSMAKRICAEGSYKRAPSISVRYLGNNTYRFSAVVSKKQGSAPERNRVKRVIRNIMRLKKQIYPPGLYLIYYNGHCDTFNRNEVEYDLDDIIEKIAKKEHSNCN